MKAIEKPDLDINYIHGTFSAHSAILLTPNFLLLHEFIINYTEDLSVTAVSRAAFRINLK